MSTPPVKHYKPVLSPYKVRERIKKEPKLTARLIRLQGPAEKALALMGRKVSQS